MREGAHVVVGVGLLGLAALACRGSPRTTPFDAGAEAAKLIPFLPARLGLFAATGAATPFGSSPGPVVEARRSYASTDGRRADVRLATGDVRSDLGILDSDDEHAFGSDSPTYWRTVTIAGRRARIAEERPTPRTSECTVRAGPNHIAEVRVTPPAAPGDCATVAALLDFAGIVATGGVPSPPIGARR